MKHILLTLVLATAVFTGCARESAHSADEHEHGAAEAAEEASRGPHGGRLLTDGDFSLELAIYETGVPPEFRAWVTSSGKPVAPADVDLAVELARLGGVVDRIQFAPHGDFLLGDQEIVEPHSFDVKITASHANREHTWTYQSYEGRTSIVADVAERSGIRTAVAGPGTIAETISLYGSIGADTTRVREVKARFPGVIRAVERRIGDRVAAGDALASVEANESLRTYAITAPIAGLITQRHAEPGEQTDTGTLFEIADFSRVWAELKVFQRDRAKLRVGQRVRISAEGTATGDGTLSHVAAASDRASQSLVARVVLDNTKGTWTPGQFVEARVTVSETPVALTVPPSALQTFRDHTVVYAQVGDTYEVRMLELGRRDATQVEVLGGLQPGTSYVVENSYLVKADIEKSGASHDH